MCLGILAAGLAPVPTAAKPPNAAVVVHDEDAGAGCLVSADFVNYQLDPTCGWQLVRRRDRNGDRALLHYRDHGQLQPGQAAPATALNNPISVPVHNLMCHGTETVTPSGQYRSSLECN